MLFFCKNVLLLTTFLRIPTTFTYIGQLTISHWKKIFNCIRIVWVRFMFVRGPISMPKYLQKKSVKFKLVEEPLLKMCWIINSGLQVTRGESKPCDLQKESKGRWFRFHTTRIVEVASKGVIKWRSVMNKRKAFLDIKYIQSLKMLL